jgi:hypothetical protein
MRFSALVYSACMVVMCVCVCVRAGSCCLFKGSRASVICLLVLWNYCLENRVIGNGVVCSLFPVLSLKAFGVHVLQHTYGVHAVHHTDPFTATKCASFSLSLWRSWGLLSSRMWRCVIGCSVPEMSGPPRHIPAESIQICSQSESVRF